MLNIEYCIHFKLNCLHFINFKYKNGDFYNITKPIGYYSNETLYIDFIKILGTNTLLPTYH